MEPLFTGVGVALVTIFDDTGALDTAATAGLATELVGTGVQAVLVAGTTGEAMTLSAQERTDLITSVRDAVPSDIPLLAGTGAVTGAQAAELTSRALDAGADAALVLSPPQVPDPRPYFDTVAKVAGDAPLMAYHFPFASTPGIPVDVLRDLPVDSLKDSSADPERLMYEAEVFGGDIYVGSSAMLSMGAAMGLAGAILTLANAEPERCIAAFGGDGNAQRELAGVHRTAVSDFPHGIKRLVNQRFGLNATTRVGR